MAKVQKLPHARTRQQQQPSAPQRAIPLPEPVTCKQMMLILVMHVCRKILFYDIHYKVIVYMLLLIFGSILCDFVALPRAYFAQKSNIFNVYFVKLGWGWTFVTVGSFILLSSYVYCCGNRNRVRKHMSRLLIATAIWYLWTSVFTYVESATGACRTFTASDKAMDKTRCLRNGHRWFGFDISGHAFLLIYCNLIIMEEVQCMKGWERINELIRNEEYDEDSPLRPLPPEEKASLTVAFGYLNIYVKMLFIFVTLLSVLWDFMLVCTIMYFHTLAQKLTGGVIAILTWYVTYRLWYKHSPFPGLPGQGPFNYSERLMKAKGSAFARR